MRQRDAAAAPHAPQPPGNDRLDHLDRARLAAAATAPGSMPAGPVTCDVSTTAAAPIEPARAGCEHLDDGELVPRLVAVATAPGSVPAASATCDASTTAAAPIEPARAGCEHLDDAELVARFEALAIAPGDFRHREHVRLAYAMLRGADFGEAAQRFRTALRRFATAAGVPGRYHETLTWAYLAVIARRLVEGPSPAGSIEFLACHPDLLDHKTGAIARHYDVADITASPLARAVFVLPER